MDKTTYIEAFLEGRLTENEKLEFEARIRDDHQFAIDYDRHLAAYALVKSHGALRVKELLQKHEMEKNGIRNSRLIRSVLSAAAVVLMITSLFFLLKPGKEYGHEDLFAMYFSPYRDPVTIRGDVVQDDTRERANAAYKAKDFEAAIRYYSEISTPTPADNLYFGLSALQSNDTDLAIAKLEEVSRLESNYKQQAAWYLSLAYLKAAKKEEAEKILREIVKDRTYMNQQAEELLEKLNSK